MRAVQITLLFMAAMLWLGVQAAQTEPAGTTPNPTAGDIPAAPLILAGKTG